MSARIVLSEVVAALSRALDLTDGQPLGHTLRSCLIGMRMGREIGLGGEELSGLYYTLLLKDAGCSSNSARLCNLFGSDDLAVKPRMRSLDRQNIVALAFRTACTVAMGKGIFGKVQHLVGIARSPEVMHDIIALRCERGAGIALRLGFASATAAGIKHLDEHWNGRGHPDGLSGQAIPVMARIANLAQVIEVYHAKSGPNAALRIARRRSGSWFDPELVQLVGTWSRDSLWWGKLGSGDVSGAVIAAEPASEVRWIGDDDLDVVAAAFADIIDAKSPYTYSHSRNVAAFALGIAREMGLGVEEQRRVYRAGLLHDIGKLGVSNSILDKPGALDASERAAVERHPFYTWEILSRVAAFRDFAWSAALHHERLDGTGYPWHLSGNRLDVVARILCVADVYEALTADRPYRAGMGWEESSRILWKGRGSAFDPAVLDALGRMHRAAGDVAVRSALAGVTRLAGAPSLVVAA